MRKHPVRSIAPVMLALSLTATAAASWQIEHIHDPHRFSVVAFAVSPAGVPTVAYVEDRLYFATFDGAAWIPSVVLPDDCLAGRAISLAFDPLGKPTIAYRDTGQVWLVRTDGTSWTRELVAASVSDSQSISLAFDGSDNTILAYEDNSTRDLTVATWDGAQWSYAVVDAVGDVGSGCDLAIDPAGLPAVVYVDLLNGLKFARFDGTSWSTEFVTTASGNDEDPALVFDPAGDPLISSSDAYSPSVRLARKSGGVWTDEVVAAERARGTDVMFDASGVPIVAYSRIPPPPTIQIPDAVLVARQIGPTWQSTTVYSNRGMHPPRLALDALGTPLLAVFDTERLMWSRFDGSSWLTATLDTTGDSGRFNSIAIDPSGFPAVAFDERISDTLQLARYDGTSWQIEVVATGNGSGYYNSLAFDAAGFPAIARITLGSPAEARLTRWDGVSWVDELIETMSFSNDAPTLAFDAAGEPTVAYIAAGQLHLAARRAATWSIEVIEPSGNPVCPALRYDSQGQPWLGYGMRDLDVLRVTTWNGTGWTTDSLPIGADPLAVSFELDVFDRPAFAYRRQPGLGTAWFAHRLATGWSFEQAAPTPTFSTTSFAFDPLRNEPAIAFEGANDQLQLARKRSGVWQIEDVAPRGLQRAEAHLAFAPTGEPLISLGPTCVRHKLLLARSVDNLVLRRGLVASIAVGWQQASLPLTSSNDDATPPFPITTSGPGSATDAAPPPTPLTLYRLLDTTDADTGNRLYAAPRPGGGIELYY